MLMSVSLKNKKKHNMLNIINLTWPKQERGEIDREGGRERERKKRKSTTSVGHSFSAKIDMKMRLVFILAVLPSGDTVEKVQLIGPISIQLSFLFVFAFFFFSDQLIQSRFSCVFLIFSFSLAERNTAVTFEWWDVSWMLTDAILVVHVNLISSVQLENKCKYVRWSWPTWQSIENDDVSIGWSCLWFLFHSLLQ